MCWCSPWGQRPCDPGRGPSVQEPMKPVQEQRCATGSWRWHVCATSYWGSALGENSGFVWPMSGLDLPRLGIMHALGPPRPQDPSDPSGPPGLWVGPPTPWDPQASGSCRPWVPQASGPPPGLRSPQALPPNYQPNPTSNSRFPVS